MTDTTTGTDVLRDPRIEAWLDERHTTWHWNPTIPIDTIDQAASLANQARLEALDPDVVDRYAADMARGDQFPPIVAHRRSTRSRRLVLIGGNHRLAAAHQAGLTTLPGYIVEAEPETVVTLTYEDNRRHGLPPSDAERVAQAIHLIDTGNYTQEAAAALVGIPAPKISTARSIVKADRRATDMGLGPTFTSMPKSARYQLGQLRSDPVFDQAARLAADAGMTVTAISELVSSLTRAGSDQAALEIIGTEQEVRRTDIQNRGGRSGGGKRVVSARAQLAGALSKILYETSPAEVAAACATGQQRADLNKQIKAAATKLFEISKAL